VSGLVLPRLGLGTVAAPAPPGHDRAAEVHDRAAIY